MSAIWQIGPSLQLHCHAFDELCFGSIGYQPDELQRLSRTHSGSSVPFVFQSVVRFVEIFCGHF